MKDKFYITTSIAYTNAPPHIGFALELTQADVLARYYRFKGNDVFFLTGTDEHGIKIVRAAEKAGKTSTEFTDELSGKFKDLTKILNLSNDDFIRTTDQKRHWPNVRKVWLAIKEKGDLYKKKYQGLYCVGCEAFVKEKDLVDGVCPIHQRKPEIIEEENYFFKLSKYAGVVKDKITGGEIKIIPEGRKNEIISFIDQGVEDISCSRSRKNLQWGVPVPDDDSQTIYVWFEALINYLFPKKYWPADVQCLGKDIFRFHALWWPAMLLSLGLPLPKVIFVHGYITSNGQKLSKSLGNIIDPFELVKKYGTDPVRYFLLREITPTEDGDFSEDKFKERYNGDLASGLGNLVARVAKLAQVSKTKKIGNERNLFAEYKIVLDASKEKYKESLEKFEFSMTLSAVWALIKFCDQEVEKNKLWEKSDKQKDIISNLLFLIDEIAGLLEPFMPETSGKILKRKTEGPLFPRI
ncbi:MAG: methionine--tRNA ligase [Candidatus Nealsonbacteria bacterium]